MEVKLSPVSTQPTSLTQREKESSLIIILNKSVNNNAKSLNWNFLKEEMKIIILYLYLLNNVLKVNNYIGILPHCSRDFWIFVINGSL